MNPGTMVVLTHDYKGDPAGTIFWYHSKVFMSDKAVCTRAEPADIGEFAKREVAWVTNQVRPPIAILKVVNK